MKKIYLFLAAVSVTAMFSACMKESTPEIQADGTVLTAGILSQTRTALDGSKVYWTNGDKIMVNGHESAALELEAPSASATFSFKADLAAPYMAVFPSSIYKDAATVTLPAVQTIGSDASFSSQASPMLAYSSADSKLSFSHPCAVVCVTVNMKGKSGTIKRFEFEGNNGEQVCGDFGVDFTDLSFAGKGADASNTLLKVNAGKALADGASCTAYIVVPAGTYQNGYTVRVVDSEYNYMEKSTTERTLASGTVYEMKAFDFEPTGKLSPSKTEKGVRSTTPTLVWKKSLSSIEGIQNVLNVNGVAAHRQYVLLSENGNPNPVYLNPLTGEKAGTYDASAITNVNSDYYATTDDNGRLCFSTYSDAAGEKMNIYVAESVTAEPVLLYSRDGSDERREGYKISVCGNTVMGANYCIPVYTTAAKDAKCMANLRVVSSGGKYVGTYQGPNYSVKAPQGWGQTWGTMCDIMMIDSFNFNAASSGARILTTAGATRNSNTLAELTLSTYTSGWTLTTSKALENPGKQFSTALDYIVFNNNEYIVYNYVNSATNKNGFDGVRLIDMSADPTLNTEYRVTNNHIHGAWHESDGTVANTNCLGDVAFVQSSDGYYLYVYLVFAGGDVACYRYDCIAD